MGRVIVVGSTNTDLVVHCSKLPAPGETVLGADLLTFAGGKGANQAVAAARAGAKVHFVGAFGNDAFGRARRSDLEREGIHCGGCATKPSVPSGVALIGIGAGGHNAKAENLIIVAPGANARLTPADVTRGLPRDLSPRDVIVCSLEVPIDCVLAAFKVGSAKGALTILNPAPCPPAGLPAALLKHVVVLTPNETEAEMILKVKLSAPAAGQKLLRLHESGCAHVIVTQGSKGVRYHASALPASATGDSIILGRNRAGIIVVKGRGRAAQGESVTFPAPKVKAVDTVGAGDCFNGSLAAWLATHPYEINEAITFAVCAAALKVTRRGAQAGMPRRNQTLQLLKALSRDGHFAARGALSSGKVISQKS